MKKTRKTVPLLTQREMRKLLRRSQTQVGFETAVTTDTDSSDDQNHGMKPGGMRMQLPSAPKERGTKR